MVWYMFVRTQTPSMYHFDATQSTFRFLVWSCLIQLDIRTKSLLASQIFLLCVWNPFRMILAPTGLMKQFSRSLRPLQDVNHKCVYSVSSAKVSSQCPCTGTFQIQGFSLCTRALGPPFSSNAKVLRQCPCTQYNSIACGLVQQWCT